MGGNRDGVESERVYGRHDFRGLVQLGASVVQLYLWCLRCEEVGVEMDGDVDDLDSLATRVKLSWSRWSRWGGTCVTRG